MTVRPAGMRIGAAAEESPAWRYSGNDEDAGGNRNQPGQHELTNAPRRDSPGRRYEPHAPARQRPPEPHTGRSAGIGKDMGRVPEPEPARQGHGDRQPKRKQQKAREADRNQARQRRVSHRPVGGQDGHGEHRKAQHRTEKSDQGVAALESAAAVNPAAELIDVGQPGAATRGCRNGNRIDGPAVAGLRGGDGQRDADQLVGCVAHPSEAISAIGCFRESARPGRGRHPGAAL
jgi:hypothetical protein